MTAEIKAELREVARSHADKAIRALVSVCESSQSDSARVAAANAILDRGYGKPLQQVETGGIGDVARMTDDEIRAFLNDEQPTAH